VLKTLQPLLHTYAETAVFIPVAVWLVEQKPAFIDKKKFSGIQEMFIL
jgi:hypothetical protein